METPHKKMTHNSLLSNPTTSACSMGNFIRSIFKSHRHTGTHTNNTLYSARSLAKRFSLCLQVASRWLPFLWMKIDIMAIALVCVCVSVCADAEQWETYCIHVCWFEMLRTRTWHWKFGVSPSIWLRNCCHLNMRECITYRPNVDAAQAFFTVHT